MRDINGFAQAALGEDTISLRWFVYLTARNRDTGNPEPAGLWSDLDSIATDVVDPNTGSAVQRTYGGAGALLSVDAFRSAGVDSENSAQIRLSQIDETVEQLIRGYDLESAPVEVHLGVLHPGTRTLVAAPDPVFVGEVGDAQIITPKEGEAGSVRLTCYTSARQFTRTNPDTQSDQSQQERSAGDRFNQHTSNTQEWQIFWGRYTGNLKWTVPPRL